MKLDITLFQGYDFKMKITVEENSSFRITFITILFQTKEKERSQQT